MRQPTIHQMREKKNHREKKSRKSKSYNIDKSLIDLFKFIKIIRLCFWGGPVSVASHSISCDPA
jgi:hypothetical protein